MTRVPLQDPGSWGDVWSMFRADLDAWARWLGNRRLSNLLFWFLLPTLQALLWFRVSRYLYLRGHRKTARLVALINLYVTRIELPPTSSIGEACVIAHAEGVIICGRIGVRAILSGGGGLGGGARQGDVGGGPGLPCVGDDVFFGQGAVVLGAVRIGDGAVLGACSLTFTDVPPGATVIAPTAIEEPATPAGAQTVETP